MMHLVTLALSLVALFGSAPTPTPAPVLTPAPVQRERFCRRLVAAIPEVCKAPPQDMGGCAELRDRLCPKEKKK